MSTSSILVSPHSISRNAGQSIQRSCSTSRLFIRDVSTLSSTITFFRSISVIYNLTTVTHQLAVLDAVKPVEPTAQEDALAGQLGTGFKVFLTPQP